MDSQEAARTGHTVASTLHANSASQTYARIMTMCQMGGTTMPVHTLMNLIIEAFPVAVFCKQVGRRHRCITEIVEAYSAYDGTALTRPIFQYIENGEEYSWERVSAISDQTAELLLSNGADANLVRHLQTDPNGQKGAKP